MINTQTQIHRLLLGTAEKRMKHSEVWSGHMICTLWQLYGVIFACKGDHLSQVQPEMVKVFSELSIRKSNLRVQGTNW